MNVNDIATRLHNAAVKAQPTDQISLEHKFDVDQAYHIQKLVVDKRLERGENLIGLKMGFTSEAKMEQMGVHDLIWGRLTSGMWIENGGSLNLSSFIHPRVEPEICFIMNSDIDRECSVEEVKELTDAVAPALEIIDSRYQNFKFTLEDVIADNCSSAGLVIGNWQPVSDNLNGLKIQMTFDSDEVGEGTSDDILGDPWKSLAAATRLAAKYGQPIRKGDVIMAGAATSASFLRKDTKVEAVVETLGSVAFHVV